MAEWLGYIVVGAQFQAKAGAACDPTFNLLRAVATDAYGHQVSSADEAMVRIVGRPFHIYLPLIMKDRS